MESGAARSLIPLVLGLAPALLVAMAWAPAGDWTPFKLLVRNSQAPIVAAELFVIVVALREGLLKAVPRWNWSRLAIAASTLLLAVAVSSAMLAPMRTTAVLLTGYWVVHALFALAVVHLCGRLFAVGDLVRGYMIGFAVFTALFFLFLHQIPDWSQFDWRTGFLAFGHIRHAGYYLAAIAGLGIGAMAVAKHRLEWAWAFATASVAIGMALWTGSRGAVLAVAAALVAGLLFAPALRSFRSWGGGIASMVVAAAAVSQLPAAPHGMMGLNRTVEATVKTSDVTTGRTKMWENVLGAIGERPLFGYGEGQMRSAAPFSDLIQPHNSILQVTLAWGLVGLLCILALAVAYARRAIPAVHKEQGELAAPFMAMIALAVLSLYDGALYYALSIGIFATCAAVIASKWKTAARRQEPFAASRTVGASGT